MERAFGELPTYFHAHLPLTTREQALSHLIQGKLSIRTARACAITAVNTNAIPALSNTAQ